MPTRGKEQWKKSTFYCAGRKATLATGRKFWQEQFVQKGRRGRGHGFCLASTSQTPTRSLPPHTAAAHGTKRHTWSRWLSKNKGFYQFVCHPSTIYLCNVSSHSSTLFLKHFPFASEAPRTFYGGNTFTLLPKQWDTKTEEQLPAYEKEQTHGTGSNHQTGLLEFYSEKESQTAGLFLFLSNLNLWY